MPHQAAIGNNTNEALFKHLSASSLNSVLPNKRFT